MPKHKNKGLLWGLFLFLFVSPCLLAQDLEEALEDISDDAPVSTGPELSTPSVSPAPEPSATSTPVPTVSATPTPSSTLSVESTSVVPVEGDQQDEIQKLGDHFEKEANALPSVEKQFEKELEALDPLDLFQRVPLRPQMSDAGWLRWAGPSLSKAYKVRKKDSLWAISQRLFGTPSLWPKVWQLNAVFGNPHVIDAGVELQFKPGNPNSAPSLAFSSRNGSEGEEMPLLVTQQPMSVLELLDHQLRLQNYGEEPPFKFFLMNEPMKQLAKMPSKDFATGTYYVSGDQFDVKKVPNGTYSIVRMISESLNDAEKGYRVQWTGVAQVLEGRGTVTKNFYDIAANDLLVPQDFKLSPLAIYDESYELKDKKPFASFVPLAEGGEAIVASEQLVGLSFPSIDRGPRAGALISLKLRGKPMATLLLLNRSAKLGTAWIVQSDQELTVFNAAKFGL